MAALGALALVVVMGAGCRFDDTVGEDDKGNNESGDYTSASCPEGTKRYVSSRENITFCYPEKVDDQNVTIEDSADNVIIKVGDKVVRVVTAKTVDEDVDREEEVLRYAATPDDDSITCEAQLVKNEKGRETYILVGKKNGVQSQDAWSACADSEKLMDELNNEPVGMFFFYDNEDDLLIVSGSQDAVLGQQTDDFEATIWPKN